MTKNLNNDVTIFLDEQNHPLRKEIEQLRFIILNSNDLLTENIKWNAPNYCFNNQDRITMRINPPKQIQIVFHCGVKVKEQPKERIIKEDFSLLDWKSNDRAVVTLKATQDIERYKTNLTKIIIEWLDKTK